MKNYIGKGEVIHVTTPAAGYTSGQVVALNDMIGVAVKTSSEGELAALQVMGVFDLPKASEAFVQGQALFWDEANQQAVSDAGAVPLGLAWADATAEALSLAVKIG